MTDREVMQQALEALEKTTANTISQAARIQEAIDSLHERLEQPEQEPVAWANLNELTEQFNSVNCGTVYRLPDEVRSPLYTSPPQRKPLTDEKIVDIVGNCAADSGGWFRYHAFARAIERAHDIGEKGE